MKNLFDAATAAEMVAHHDHTRQQQEEDQSQLPDPAEPGSRQDHADDVLRKHLGKRAAAHAPGLEDQPERAGQQGDRQAAETNQ